MKFGSHLYGTATPSSDEDFKGVFMPTAEQILLGRIPKTHREGETDDTRKNEPGELDCQFYSLHHFLRLATQGQTVAIDMLFAPENCVFKDTEHGWIWDDLIKNRKLLLSKQMNAFTGYARSQAAKYSLKGDRLNKLREFLAIVENYKELLPLRNIWDKLPKDGERVNPQGIRELNICGKWIGEGVHTADAATIVGHQIARYGKRADDAANAAGIDWKAISHAVRVTKELLEILSFGEVTFPLRDADLLLKIKQGKLSLEEVQDIIDRDLAFVELQTRQSTLPDRVDQKFWENWLIDITKRTLL